MVNPKHEAERLRQELAACKESAARLRGERDAAWAREEQALGRLAVLEGKIDAARAALA